MPDCLPTPSARRTRLVWPAALLTALLSCIALPSCAAAQAAPITLQQAETLLLQGNPSIIAARRALEGATADITIAGQAPNPVVTYSNQHYSKQEGLGPGRWADKRLDQIVLIQQPIERGNRRELRRSGAEALENAARADYADTRRQQRLALHQAWYDWLAATEKDRLLNETADLYKRGMVATNLRLKVGDIARVEASRLRIEALRAENEARRADAEREKTRANVAVLLGEPDAKTLQAVIAWPPLDVPKAHADADLDMRPDMRAATARIEVGEKKRDIARSLTTRDIVVGAQVERDPATIPGVTYGVQVSFPLFVRYGYEGERARAEADYGLALDDRERVRQSASAEIVRARAELDAAIERRRRIEEETLPQARDVSAASEFAWKKGALNLTDLLDARRTLRAVEMDAVDARADHAKALAAWLAATRWEQEGEEQ